MLSRLIGRSFLRLKAQSIPQRPNLQSFRYLSTENSFLRISEEVREAIHAKKPVVALETTIYTHGYPYPDNIALASELESIVRINGGVPATIGILNGVARVGLSPEELIQLASSAGQENTLKLSRRDLGFVCGLRLTGKRFNGGTTIAGTMILAHLAGIRVFATGGLGGVHRGAESTMDISADLTELGRTPMAVISSGCKSFLDIPRTLEYLETEGVGVATFADGRQGNVDFPAFWSRDSGVRSPMTVQDEKEAAAITYAQLNLPLTSGLHFANPIPTEASIPKAEIDSIIEEAVRQANKAGITGKDNTPFILSKIKELSGGKSINANRALIASNVKRGAIVAREMAALESQIEGLGEDSGVYIPGDYAEVEADRRTNVAPVSNPTPPSDLDINSSPVDVVVAGALAVDYSCDYAPFQEAKNNQTPQLHTSNPSVIRQSLGGVAHNVAKAAHYLGSNVQLFSAVGDDLPGRVAVQQLSAEGMQTGGIKTVDSASGARTAQYVAVNDLKKDLVLAMADMGILERAHGLIPAWKYQLELAQPKWFVADANWDGQSLQTLLRIAKEGGIRTAFEPVSTAKASRIFAKPHNSATDGNQSEHKELQVFPNNLVDITTPNILELRAMHSVARSAGLFERQDWWSVIDDLGIPSSGARTRFINATSAELVDQGVPQQSIQLLPFIPCLLTKLGPKGVLLTMLLRGDDDRLRSADAAPYIISRSRNEDPKGQVGGVYMRIFPAAEILADGQIVSVNGIGDTFLGTLIAGLARTEKGVEDLVDFAQKAAVLTLKSQEAVSPKLRHLRL